jgi:signal peptidase I
MILSIIILAAIAALLWLIRAWVIFPAYIVSDSMSPTLEKGDIVLVNRLCLRTGRSIKRGDVVVFKAADGRRTVKRVAGLPGDKMRTFDGLCIVPRGKLFLFGDKGGNSLDSRVYGAVDGASIIGVVVTYLGNIHNDKRTTQLG